MGAALITISLCCTLFGCGRSAPMSPESRHREAIAELSAARGELERFYALGEASKQSVAMGKLAEARKYAEELLLLAPKFKRDWNYGNAIHDGNMVLGRVALKGGQVDAAKAYLLQAGATPGSPQLNTFGPNMSLAQDLIEAGDREAVVQYFKLCRKFWEMQDGKLDQWTRQVQAGEHPQFGANLFY